MFHIPVREKEPEAVTDRQHLVAIDKRVIPLHHKSVHSWPSKMFGFPKLCVVDTVGDGSCFFHAIVSSFYPLYYFTESLQSKSRVIQQFRSELAQILASPAPRHIVDACLKTQHQLSSLDGQSNEPEKRLRYYDILSRGSLKQLSESVPEFSLKHMQAALRSNQAVDLSFLEFISLFLNKNIFLLSREHQDVYCTGDRELLEHPDRQCIVVMAGGNHYELAGLHDKSQGVVKTIFRYDDQLIQSIRERLDVLTKRTAGNPSDASSSTSSTSKQSPTTAALPSEA